MKILVTGVGGFIGSNFVPFLKERGHFVRGVDKALRKNRKHLINQADEVIYYDLEDLRSAILACNGMDYVIHMAADMGGVGYFSTNGYGPFVKNMQIDLNILQACEMTNVKRLYYASSACAYPTQIQMEEGKPPKLSEDMLIPANSDQMYGWEKFMITHLARSAPIDVRVGIQHTIFGPYQETEGERMKFPTAIATKVLDAKKNTKGDKPPTIEIWGNGKQMRSFLYIDDAMEKIYRVLTDSVYPGPVNIGSDQAYTVTEIAQMCCELTGISKRTFKYTNTKPSGVLARNCDNTLFNKFYDYRDRFTMREGFKLLIDWITEENRIKNAIEPKVNE